MLVRAYICDTWDLKLFGCFTIFVTYYCVKGRTKVSINRLSINWFIRLDFSKYWFLQSCFQLTFSCSLKLSVLTSSFAISSWWEISKCVLRSISNSDCIAKLKKSRKIVIDIHLRLHEFMKRSSYLNDFFSNSTLWILRCSPSISYGIMNSRTLSKFISCLFKIVGGRFAKTMFNHDVNILFYTHFSFEKYNRV